MNGLASFESHSSLEFVQHEATVMSPSFPMVLRPVAFSDLLLSDDLLPQLPKYHAVKLCMWSSSTPLRHLAMLIVNVLDCDPKLQVQVLSRRGIRCDCCVILCYEHRPRRRD